MLKAEKWAAEEMVEKFPRLANAIERNEGLHTIHGVGLILWHAHHPCGGHYMHSNCASCFTVREQIKAAIRNRHKYGHGNIVLDHKE